MHDNYENELFGMRIRKEGDKPYTKIDDLMFQRDKLREELLQIEKEIDGERSTRSSHWNASDIEDHSIRGNNGW